MPDALQVGALLHPEGLRVQARPQADFRKQVEEGVGVLAQGVQAHFALVIPQAGRERGGHELQAVLQLLRGEALGAAGLEHGRIQVEGGQVLGLGGQVGMAEEYRHLDQGQGGVRHQVGDHALIQDHPVTAGMGRLEGEFGIADFGIMRRQVRLGFGCLGLFGLLASLAWRRATGSQIGRWRRTGRDGSRCLIPHLLPSRLRPLWRASSSQRLRRAVLAAPVSSSSGRMTPMVEFLR